MDLLETQRTRNAGHFVCVNGAHFPCAECGIPVAVLTHTHMKNHASHLIQTQEEYCIAHPEHSFMHMWSDLPEQKNRAKYVKWRKKGEKQRKKESKGERV